MEESGGLRGGAVRMDTEGFGKFLKRGGRSPSAIKRCLAHVKEFEAYLQAQKGRGLDEASPADVADFATWIEREPKASAKTHLWAIRYYYEYTANEEVHHLASILRGERIKRTPFALGKFRGVNPEYVDRLAAAGISNVEQMLKAGRTPGDREALSAQTGVPLDAILEFVKLSDLARIPGMKGIRARLYHDAGVDTIEKLAAWDPEELGAKLTEFVGRTGFDGIAPLPKEVAFSVTTARRLPKIIEYEEEMSWTK
jgi:hypothetical protein